MMKALVMSSIGNTPTGVGKTLVTPNIKRLSEKHPHGRGEDARRRAIERA